MQRINKLLPSQSFAIDTIRSYRMLPQMSITTKHIIEMVKSYIRLNPLNKTIYTQYQPRDHLGSFGIRDYFFVSHQSVIK